MIEKNKEYIVDIIDNGLDGQGIAKIDNFTIFVDQTTKGEKVKILILKVNKNYAYAKALKILQKSPNRVETDCSTYKKCGGCSLRFLDYEETLNIKEEMVRNCIKKALGKEIKINKTIGMENPYNYRNKLQYPLGLDEQGKPTMGVYAKRTHKIIPVQKCEIQNELSEKIAKSIFEYCVKNDVSMYDEKSLKEIMRHIVIRIGVMTNEIMVILVINEKFPKIEQFVKEIASQYSEIKTIVLNYNTKNTNVILGNKNEIVYGEGYIYDILGDYKFKISPMSFYQTNVTQTEVLYNKALEYAELTGNETVLDLYCGIGTIGIFASKKAKQVYGIEIVENAIKDAKENAKINNIQKAKFYCGDVEEILPQIIKQTNLKPQTIFVDPPRKGLDTKTIQTILNLKPQKLIYISCNPSTLARDLAMLDTAYEIKEITPVDMFPYTRTLRSGDWIRIEKNLLLILGVDFSL